MQDDSIQSRLRYNRHGSQKLGYRKQHGACQCVMSDIKSKTMDRQLVCIVQTVGDDDDDDEGDDGVDDNEATSEHGGVGEDPQRTVRMTMRPYQSMGGVGEDGEDEGEGHIRGR
ncbi:hypothetical protein ACOMHN_001909 [Nucella lapillus]